MNVFTCRDLDGICMGKTIALKLSKREEQIIALFNEKGMTNSELLRSALRQYVQNMPEFSSDDALINNIFVKQEDAQTGFFDSVKELKSDMQGLQEQLVNIQKKVESEMKTLQRQFYLLTAASNSQQDPSSVKLDIARDIHQQVDEFLYKQTKKMV